MPIFDQGYQNWKGPLTSHAWRWLTITRHGLRVHMKNRILRLLLLIAWLPAIALVVAVALWGMIEQKSAGILSLVANILPIEVLQNPSAFRVVVWTLAYSFFFKFQIFFIMLLTVIIGPGLISRDLRFNGVLPLYFARPMTRLDYFLGKLGVIAVLVGLVAVGPAVFAYVIGVCFSLDLTVVRDTYPILLGSIAYGLIITLSVGTLMLAMSSLTRRSLFVGITWAGMWIITATIGSVMAEIHRETLRREAVETTMAKWVAENPAPAGVQMFHNYPRTRWDHEKRKEFLVGVPPEREAEGERWLQSWRQANNQAWFMGMEVRGDALKNDWRPMLSYVRNLERLSDALLDTDGAWVTVGKAQEQSRKMMGPMFGPKMKQPPANDRRIANEMVLQYPWYWSAGLLAGLMGLSAWILSRRVKSLDRLK